MRSIQRAALLQRVIATRQKALLVASSVRCYVNTDVHRTGMLMRDVRGVNAGVQNAVLLLVEG